MSEGGWMDQVALKLTLSPAKAGVEVGTSLAIVINIEQYYLSVLTCAYMCLHG